MQATFAIVLPIYTLEFVAVKTLGPQPRARSENIFIIVMTERYPKKLRVIPTSKTKAANVAIVFLDHWIVPYAIRDHLLTEDGPQFVSKLFALL